MLPCAASLPAACRLHARRMPALPQLSTSRAAPWGLHALSCGYAPDAHAQPLRCWLHSRAAEGAWGAHPGLVLPLRCASHTRARSAAADAQETGDRAQTQAWPRTEPTQDGPQSSAVLAAAAPPAGSGVDAAHAGTATNGTQGQEGASGRRSDAGEGGAGAGSRGPSGAQSSSAAAEARAEAPREGARPSGSGHRAEGAAQTLSHPRGLDHAEASAAIAEEPRPPDRAGAGGSDDKRAGPSRRAGEQKKKKSDAEKEEDDAAGLAWLARLGGAWGTDMPSTVAGWRARALSYMRESFLIGYTTVVRRRAPAKAAPVKAAAYLANAPAPRAIDVSALHRLHSAPASFAQRIEVLGFRSIP